MPLLPHGALCLTMGTLVLLPLPLRAAPGRQEVRVLVLPRTQEKATAGPAVVSMLTRPPRAGRSETSVTVRPRGERRRMSAPEEPGPGRALLQVLDLTALGEARRPGDRSPQGGGGRLPGEGPPAAGDGPGSGGTGAEGETRLFFLGSDESFFSPVGGTLGVRLRTFFGRSLFLYATPRLSLLPWSEPFVAEQQRLLVVAGEPFLVTETTRGRRLAWQAGGGAVAGAGWRLPLSESVALDVSAGGGVLWTGGRQGAWGEAALGLGVQAGPLRLGLDISYGAFRARGLHHGPGVGLRGGLRL